MINTVWIWSHFIIANDNSALSRTSNASIGHLPENQLRFVDQVGESQDRSRKARFRVCRCRRWCRRRVWCANRRAAFFARGGRLLLAAKVDVANTLLHNGDSFHPRFAAKCEMSGNGAQSNVSHLFLKIYTDLKIDSRNSKLLIPNDKLSNLAIQEIVHLAIPPDCSILEPSSSTLKITNRNIQSINQVFLSQIWRLRSLDAYY